MSFFRFEHLSKTFSSNELFSDISFSFPPTGFVSLLGSSGSGKTTLFYLLTGLEKKDEGKIFFNDKELISEIDFRVFRKECSFIFQEYGVLNYLSAKDNLDLGGYEIEIDDIFLKKDLFNKKVQTFSGGEKQRLAILKTIRLGSKIVFCDEPTGSLDEQNGETIMEELKKISKKSLVIMVSHNLDLVYKYSNIILELKDKKLNLLKNDKSLYKTKNNNKKMSASILKELLISYKSFVQDKFKLCLTFIALLLSFASILLVYNLNIYAKETINEASKTYADYERLKIFEVENTKIEGTSFSLSKIKRPDIKNIKSALNNNAEIEYNLDYFLSLAKISYKNENININIVTFPYGSGLEDLRINAQAKSIFVDLEEKIHIAIRQEVITKYKDKVYSDEVNLSLDCYVHYVYQEFDFLNAPCIFISHDALKNYMKSIQLNSLSTSRGVFTSLYDRYSAFSEDDEVYSSYSFYVDVKNKDMVKNIINTLKDLDNISVESRAIQVSESLLTSFKLIEMLMSLFTFIALVLTCALLYLMMLSSFQKRKKEFSLYHTYGHAFINFLVDILMPFFSMLFLTYILSIFIYKISGKYLNVVFFKYFKCDVFASNSLSLRQLVLHLIIIFTFSLVFSSFFALKAQNLKVSEVIKSE